MPKHQLVLTAIAQQISVATLPSRVSCAFQQALTIWRCLVRAIVGGVLLLCIGAAGYVALSQASPKEELTALLQDNLEPEATVSLDACDLLITVAQAGTGDAPIALTRLVLRADLRNYQFRTGRVVPRADGVAMMIARKPATDAMLDQVRDVIDTVQDRVPDNFADRNALRDLLDAEDGAIFFRVMAEVDTSGETTTLIAHEDAPDFFNFSQIVEALPAPASFRSTTTFASGGPSAQTLLTGEVQAVPALQFNLPSEDEVKKLGQAFYDYAASAGCT